MFVKDEKRLTDATRYADLVTILCVLKFVSTVESTYCDHG
jgi:hypothetical protein